MFLNLTLITICGFYMNLIYEIMAPLFLFKISYFEAILKLLEDKQIINFAQNHKSFFVLYLMNKEYLSKNSLFILKNKIIDATYFYNSKNMLTKSQKFNKEFNCYLINMINSKDDFAARNNVYEKIQMSEFNESYNNINFNNNNVKPSDVLLNNININNELNIINIKHNVDDYLN
jgi:hypothetical protein